LGYITEICVLVRLDILAGLFDPLAYGPNAFGNPVTSVVGGINLRLQGCSTKPRIYSQGWEGGTPISTAGTYYLHFESGIAGGIPAGATDYSVVDVQTILFDQDGDNIKCSGTVSGLSYTDVSGDVQFDIASPCP